MSKLCLLLLLVAAAYAYPASQFEDEAVDYLADPESEDLPYNLEEETDFEDDFEEDSVPSLWGVFKDSWKTLKDGIDKISKNKVKKLINLLKKKFCSQENDFEEDEEVKEPKKGSLAEKLNKLQQSMKELYGKAKEKYAGKKEKVKEEMKKLNKIFCAKLEKLDQQEEDVEEDNEDEPEDLPYYLEEEADEEIDQLQEDFEEDSVPSLWGVFKDSWKTLKDGINKITDKKVKEAIGLLKKRLCSQQNDFEEDEEVKEPKKGSLAEKLLKLQKSMKELYGKAKEKFAGKKEKLMEELKKMNKIFCAKLEKLDQQEDFEEDDGDDEERGWGKNFGKWGKQIGKKLLKKMKSGAKKLMKNGAKYLKKNAVKVTPLECEGKTCKSCIKTMVGLSACIEMTLSRTNKETYLDIKGTVNDEPKFSKNIKLGDVPSCVDIGGPIGKICLKGLEGKGKSSSGKANVNFCLAVLAEKHGVGCKFCASHQNGKFKVKMSPKLFAGGTSEDGDMVEISDNGEDGQALLGPDEYELD